MRLVVFRNIRTPYLSTPRIISSTTSLGTDCEKSTPRTSAAKVVCKGTNWSGIFGKIGFGEVYGVLSSDRFPHNRRHTRLLVVLHGRRGMASLGSSQPNQSDASENVPPPSAIYSSLDTLLSALPDTFTFAICLFNRRPLR